MFFFPSSFVDSLEKPRGRLLAKLAQRSDMELENEGKLR